MTEYYFEDQADWTIECLEASIDTEKQLVTEEHEFMDKLLAWENMILHLDERWSEGTIFYKINSEIAEKLSQLIKVMEEGQLKDLKLEKEETALRDKLSADVKHRDWKAIKHDIKQEHKSAKKGVRLNKHELKYLNSTFYKLTKLIKRRWLPTAEKMKKYNNKEDFESAKLEEYYLIKIYKFLSAYEEIFRQLWEKEENIHKKLKKN